MSATTLTVLFEQFLGEKMSPAEIQQLRQYIQDDRYHEALDKLLQSAYSDPSLAVDGEHDLNLVFRELMTRAAAAREAIAVKPVRRLRFMAARWAAAAIVILAVGIGGYFVFFNKKVPGPAMQASRWNKDVTAPQRHKAMLTLADGRMIALDSARNGALARQGVVQIDKLSEGQIAYSGAGGSTGKNTLSVPRGSKPVTVTLADGTQVWVDAGSSLTYPVAFSGEERRVAVTGQAYFEVAHVERKNGAGRMPFIVDLPAGNEVDVVGTHFNVNAFEDEATAKITLLQGSIKIVRRTRHETQTLQPGEQAEVSGISIRLIRDPDIEEVMAWKNGRFYYDGTDIQVVMRQVARWYDVKVEFATPMNYSCVADISRDVPVSRLLKILELTKMMHFKIEDDRIIVSKE